MGRQFPPAHARIIGTAIAGIERGARADAAHFLRDIAEAPAARAEPAQIGRGVAPGGKFPVEHGGDARLIDHDVAGAEIIVRQPRGHGRRRGSLKVAQPPFQCGARRALAIQRAALGGDKGQRSIVRRGPKEVQILARRRDGLNACELAPQRHRERLASPAERFALHHAMPGRDAADAAHNEEGRAGNGLVFAKEKRLRDGHARGACGPQQRILRRARQRDGEGGGIVRPQHPTLGGAAMHNVQGPVLLDGAAGKQRRARDAKRRIASGHAQKTLDGGAARLIHAGRPRRRTRCPRSAVCWQ